MHRSHVMSSTYASNSVYSKKNPIGRLVLHSSDQKRATSSEHLIESVANNKDYIRFCKWRDVFGDFDPFGDFELIFPAADMGLGIVEIPVHYKARTYGETNIRRFYHGFILLKMTFIATFFIKLGFQNARFHKAEKR